MGFLKQIRQIRGTPVILAGIVLIFAGFIIFLWRILHGIFYGRWFETCIGQMTPEWCTTISQWQTSWLRKSLLWLLTSDIGLIFIGLGLVLVVVGGLRSRWGRRRARR